MDNSAEPKQGTVTSAPTAAAVDPNFERRRRIRKWLIVIALGAFAVFVYITAMVKMEEAHHLVHFM